MTIPLKTLFQQWFRSLKDDGTLWCESSNLAEVQERSPGMRIEILQIWNVVDPWRPLPESCCTDCVERCNWNCRCHALAIRKLGTGTDEPIPVPHDPGEPGTGRDPATVLAGDHVRSNGHQTRPHDGCPLCEAELSYRLDQ